MFNNKLMQSALDIAKIGLRENEVPVGTIIVDPQNNTIISSAYNLVEKKKDPTAHAEILAIQSACNKFASKSLAGLDLYVTLQPCMMCLQAIIYAKIRRVYFGAYDPKTSLNLPSSNHHVEIYGGINEEDCKALLNQFFVDKRTIKSIF